MSRFYFCKFKVINRNSIIKQVTNPDVYLGAWGGSKCRDSPVQAGNRKCDCAQGQCKAGDNYIKDFKDTYKAVIPFDGKIAAFTAESIQVR